jgi:hypothetical protein
MDVQNSLPDQEIEGDQPPSELPILRRRQITGKLSCLLLRSGGLQCSAKGLEAELFQLPMGMVRTFL